MRATSIRSSRLQRARFVLVSGLLALVVSTQAPVQAAPGDTADLSITGVGSSPGVKVGRDVSFVLRAVNDGPDAASNIAVEVVLDSAFTLAAADAAGGTCTITPVVVCSRDSLGQGAIFNVTIRATTTATGSADITGAVESDSIDLELTNNTVTFTTQVGPESSKCDLWGTAGRDRISGSGAGEVICGRGGNDRLAGRGGRDRLLGAAGRDLLLGGAGGDVLIGGAGRDRLLGGPGRDRCPASAGDIRRSCSR
jgi:Ca2+-binding RTX toxin-like protein